MRSLFCTLKFLKMLSGVYLLSRNILVSMLPASWLRCISHTFATGIPKQHSVNVSFCKFRRSLARISRAMQRRNVHDWKASENSLAVQSHVQEIHNGFSRTGTQSSCGHKPELWRVHCWHLECLSSLAFPFDWVTSAAKVACFYAFIFSLTAYALWSKSKGLAKC